MVYRDCGLGLFSFYILNDTSCFLFSRFQYLERKKGASSVASRRVNMATIKNLKIKTATCKRIVKELDSYKKEVEAEAAKTASMKDAGADPYDIKQQVLNFITP